MYYKHIKSYNNLTYSIDMLRIKTFVDYNIWSNLDFYLRTYYNNKIEKYWTSDKISQFKYNYKIEIEEGVGFYIGFHHNNTKAEDDYQLHNLTVEFNPNKVKEDKLLQHILNLSGEWYIRSYDLAVDLNINILDIIYDKGRKRKVHIFSNGGDDITYEIGQGECRLKIYNKKRESKLDMLGDLTRIEISRKLEDYPINEIKNLKYGTEYFPEIYINNYIYSINDLQDKTMLPIIYAIQHGYPLNDLSRRYKEKIKKLFEGGNQIRFTDKDATQVLHQTIFAYFMKNNKVKWR